MSLKSAVVPCYCSEVMQKTGSAMPEDHCISWYPNLRYASAFASSKGEKWITHYWSRSKQTGNFRYNILKQANKHRFGEDMYLESTWMVKRLGLLSKFVNFCKTKLSIKKYFSLKLRVAEYNLDTEATFRLLQQGTKGC